MHWHKSRRQYGRHRLEEEKELPKNPMQLFDEWFKKAAEHKSLDPEAMTLSTVADAPEGAQPHSRVVLLKAYSDDGFLFFTNSESQKGRDMRSNPRVALNVYWKDLERQVVVLGKASQAPKSVSDDYFASRPFLSKVGAHVSRQSERIENREVLDRRFEQALKKFESTEGRVVPRPEHWGGYLVEPHAIEFWQGRQNRLHDRILYKRDKSHWRFERLAP